MREMWIRALRGAFPRFSGNREGARKPDDRGDKPRAFERVSKAEMAAAHWGSWESASRKISPEDFHFDFIFRLSRKLHFLTKNPWLNRIHEEDSYLSFYQRITVYLILKNVASDITIINK